MENKNFSQNEAPDQDTLAAQNEAARVNPQRERDNKEAGARGSNHVGQGSSGDATHLPVTAEGTQRHQPSEPSRTGNSAQNPEDKNLDEDMEMDLGTDEEDPADELAS